MSDNLQNALFSEMLGQSSSATTEPNANRDEVCRRLIAGGLAVDVAGTVTGSFTSVPNVSVATGTLAVNHGGTGLTAGTSGGVLGFTAAGTVASSAALTVNGVVIGGGAGATPTATAAGGVNTVLHGSAGAPVFAAVVEGDLGLTDVTTANVSIAAHGFTPKAPNDVTKFLDGTGAWSVPGGLDILQIEAML